MKKILKLILLVFFFIDIGLFINTNEQSLYRIIKWQHKCHATSWIIETQPTCTAYGQMIQQCSTCKKTIKTAPLKKLNHEPDKNWITVKEPSCINPGISIQLCKHCHSILHKKEIPATGHHYKNNHCMNCGDEIYKDADSKTLILSASTLEDLNIPASGNIIIPEKVNYEGINYTIIGIGYGLFYECKNITSVTLPDTIKYIKGHAFDFCENLQTINLPDGLLTIDEAAFQCCYKLQHVLLPDTVETIGNFAFNHCQSLDADSFHIPTNIKLMGRYTSYPAHMFYDCGKDDFRAFDIKNNKNGYTVEDGILYADDNKTLVSIPRGKQFENNTYIMPNTIEHIGELSFSRNTHIKTVVISDNLLIDGHMNQKERSSYNNITNQLSAACYVYSTVNRYETRNSNTHYKAVDGVLYNKNMTTVIAVPNQYEDVLNVPEGVTTWSYEAIWTDLDDFKDLAFNKMTEIHIPASMTDIDEHQIENLNNIHDMYGTVINIDETNETYTIKDGHITKM